ncbi:serine/threonine-protein kinase, partial [Mesorhizobium sp.]
MSADDKTRISPNVANTAVGTQLSGIYELDERIAFGGMGEVYRGHNIQTGDHVAIKIVLPEFARDQTILSLFRKEASILNHLSHDAVVRYHVFTIDPGIGRPYLAMEFVDGQSLFDVMRRGPMPTEDVRKLCHRLASGLSAVHQAGAIHRDLSPDNIILPGGRVERAKIIDFGIARSATVGGETLIGGKFAGKYNYVSPEQLGLYSGDVSEQSDIYSLGLVLAAALRGKPIDMGGSQFEIVEKRRTVPDLSDIDADFRGIVEAMLQPDPQDRPISMADIARMTRDDTDEETTPPASITPRDRTGLPRRGGTVAPGPKLQSQPPAAPGERVFVPHVRPAHLSEPRPSAVAGPPRAVLPNVPGKSAKTRSIAIAALATLAVASGAGIYLTGLMTPST